MTGSSSPFLASSVRSRPNARKAGVFTSFLPPVVSPLPSCSDSGGVKFGSSSFRDFVARPLDIDFQTLEHARGDAFAFAQKSEQNVFGADVGMIERLCFLAGERENFFHARRVRNVPDHLGLGSGADLLLDFHPHRFEIEPHLLQNVDGNALPQLDQPEQQMLGPDVIMIEAISFFAGERQDLLGPRREIIHCFAAQASIRSPTPAPLY